MRRHFAHAAVMAAVAASVGLVGLTTAETGRPAATSLEPSTPGVVRTIRRYQHATWRWQRLMGVPRTPSRKRYLRTGDREYRLHVLRQWRGRAVRAKRRAHNPPHLRHWRCLQRHEGRWNDDDDPYWGGLQMDRGFMRRYAPGQLLRRGWANRWTPIEQMWVGERALRAGRGFYPWPHTARICGLL